MIKNLYQKHVSTAALVCAFRGALSYDDSHPLSGLFKDKYASKLCGFPLTCAFLFPPLTLSLFFLTFRKLIPGSAVILVRAYYMEKQLAEQVRQGVNQYVMVAAGMDSFLLRKRGLAEKMTVFEVDLPQIQQEKKQKLTKLGCHFPSNYHFVSADLARQSLKESLQDHGFDFGKKAFFSLMGLIYYLPKASFLEMMKGIAEASVAGTMVIFDFLYDDASLNDSQKAWKSDCSDMVSSCGEDFIYDTSAHQLEKDLADLGYHQESMMSLQDLYPSIGLDDHPTAGPSCFGIAVFSVK
ncbi:MAG: class I SAM-dependent methyltransferase [Proteobacteria bacterium]|nr:class I SAM-dependent methyltransferase [Pseudomonadota bacterium]